MSVEKKAHAASGWGMLGVNLGMYLLSPVLFIVAISQMTSWNGNALFGFFLLLASCALFIAAIIVSCGFFTLQPGQARVCVLFGKYVGTVRDEGFRWANPFYSRSLGTSSQGGVETASSGSKTVDALSSLGGHRHASKISTRARTYTGDRIKVNDKMGNPIEIATVIVWHVQDTAKALFDVDDYESYVEMITETGLRHVASLYAYDHMEDDDSNASTTITLRTNIEEVSEALKAELDRKLEVAGVEVDDARLTHLAYAQEIAQAMLRRQQAEAIIAARKKIVEGAVSMVDMALSQLSDGGVVDFDEDRKAVMASNLMVVLCGDSEAQPVVNTGSLYQ
ncbi:MAG: SPFH domain-containing protein [Atopobiaceae bacterium]|nr:SPFH domain-containing protein [Atopobiaceae bacterium]MBR1830241.1 SPFH domain-containing protein [Atopobiaceae bacterium]